MENICAMLFQFFGYGFRLAMSKVGWIVTQKFDIMVPDPIGVSPSWSLRCGTRVSSGLMRGRLRSWGKASRQGLFCSFFSKTHQAGLFLCSCAEPQTSREKWTRTGKWDSRGSVMVDCLCAFVHLVYFFSQDDGGG